MATRLVKIKKYKKKPKIMQVVSLEMKSIQRSHESLPSTSSTALFHGNYITGGTFNVHVFNKVQYNGFAKSKTQRFLRLRPLESSDSSQGDSQYVI